MIVWAFRWNTNFEKCQVYRCGVCYSSSHMLQTKIQFTVEHSWHFLHEALGKFQSKHVWLVWVQLCCCVRCDFLFAFLCRCIHHWLFISVLLWILKILCYGIKLWCLSETHSAPPSPLFSWSFFSPACCCYSKGNTLFLFLPLEFETLPVCLCLGMHSAHKRLGFHISKIKDDIYFIAGNAYKT